MAYTAFGASESLLATPVKLTRERSETTEQQALVVRKFEIASGSLRDTLSAFESLTEIHVTFSEEGLKSLHSPGVAGLYSPEQALKVLLSESGATFYFTTRDEVTIRLASVATSVEVSAQLLEMLPSPKYTELLQDTPQTIHVISQQIHGVADTPVVKVLAPAVHLRGRNLGRIIHHRGQHARLVHVGFPEGDGKLMILP